MDEKRGQESERKKQQSVMGSYGPFFFFKNKKKVLCSRADLQCCVNFCSKPKSFSYIYIYENVYLLFFVFFSITVYHRILNTVTCAIQ